MTASDTQFASHPSSPYYAPRVDKKAIAERVEILALEEYDACGLLFDEWVHNEFCVANPELVVSLVVRAAGDQLSQQVATGIARQIKESWMEYARNSESFRERAVRGMS